MKAFINILAIGLGSLIMAFIPLNNGEAITIKPEASSIEWHAEKITGSHSGTVALKNGILTIENNDKLIGGFFVVDMNKIVVTDIEGKGKAKLEGHLNSADFFNVAEHPEASFKITSVKPMDNEDVTFNTEITGQLTIKGITHPITFPAKVEMQKGKISAYGEMTIDRTKYNIKYGSSSFFDDLGDRAIDNEFTLKISLGGLRN
jgi:polyisoprenoid-binding protein YceI